MKIIKDENIKLIMKIKELEKVNELTIEKFREILHDRK